MKRTRSMSIASLALGFSLIALSCGDSKDTTSGDSGGGGVTTPATPTGCTTLKYDDAPEGGEVKDLAQLSSGGDDTSFDPGAVQTLDESQITSSLFDGLTEFDFTDTCKPVLKPLVAETVTPNADATEWVFKIKKGLVFADGSSVKPSNFKREWERAGSAEFASPYGYLIAYVKGGDKLQDGSAKDLPDLKADDEAMTLTVPLSAPNADFDAIVSHTFFMPVADADLDRLGSAPAAGATRAPRSVTVRSSSCPQMRRIPVRS